MTDPSGAFSGCMSFPSIRSPTLLVLVWTGVRSSISNEVPEGTDTVRVSDAGTTVDFDFPIPVDCNSTPPGVGSTCGVTTSFNAILPGFVKFDPASPNRNRQTIEIGQVQVYDSGVDKVRGTNDDTLFAVQGIWNP